MKIIIARADISALMVHAEEVLKKYGGPHDVPEKIRGQATLSVMKKLFENGSHFNVCAVNELAKMNEITIAAEHKELFQSLHCVDWADIHPDTREYLMALLVHYFKGNMVMSYVETH